MALAYINKHCHSSSDSGPAQSGNNASSSAVNDGSLRGNANAEMTGRILVVSVSGDLGSQYVSVMNAIFAAQRSRVPIDIAKIAGDTVFLQQASDSTGGIYMELQHPESLLQYLMVSFLGEDVEGMR